MHKVTTHTRVILHKSIEKLTLWLLLFAFVLPIFAVACENPNVQDSDSYVSFTSYKDIPGITEDEIKAIENLQEKHKGRFVKISPYNPLFESSNARRARGRILSHRASHGLRVMPANVSSGRFG